jgi:hypothetical protein
MTPEAKAPAAIQAVLAWLEAYDIEDSEYIADKEVVQFTLTVRDVSYTGTCYMADANTMTVTLGVEVPSAHDELTLRRRIAAVDLSNAYGALIYHEELQMVLWRDSVYTDSPELFDEDFIQGFVECGIESHEKMLHQMADIFGATSASVAFSQQVPAGRA